MPKDKGEKIMKNLIVLTTIAIIATNIFSFKQAEPMSVEDMAEHCEISVSDFELFAGVVEAESNRQSPTEADMSRYTTDGRIFIALTVWNRVYSEIFPDDVHSVLCQSGQFSTVSGGVSCTSPTDYSRYAVLFAYDWIHSGEEYPEVLFFNCRYWFSGREPYGDSDIDGNFFSL